MRWGTRSDLLVRGVEGVGEQGVLDVVGGELEVLLLVFQAECKTGEDVKFVLCQIAFEKFGDGLIDVGAVGEDIGERRAGEAGAEVLGGHLAKRVVVGVEEPVKVGVEGFVPGGIGSEKEGLEEPAGVSEVPLERAGVGA
jgi:hypothetical protein